MKTESLAHVLKQSLTLAAVLAMFALTPLARAASVDELLEQGIYLEETKGELKAATEVYRKILDDPAANRSLVAQAHLRLGLCELKLGNKPQAISALERLTQEFPDKNVLLAIVQDHMPALLDQMIKQIEQNYILEVDRSELMDTAIRAIVGKLGAGANFLRTNDMVFMDAREVENLNVHIEQKVAGIGAALHIDEPTREIVVTTVLPRSPAVKGGVLTGDRIVGIDDVELAPETKLEEVIKRLRGPVGTAVTVAVKREGAQNLLKLELVRDVINLATVKGRHYRADQSWEFMLDEQRRIGYIRLEYLGKQAVAEMRAALNDLTARQMKGLILDLRHNPGGSLDEAIAVSDLFVENGRIVTVKSRGGEKAYDAKAEGTFSGFPITVLADRQTASAAEIIAACLQDHQRARVVGERTFGQGIVRSLVQLQGGLGALRLPVAAYYRPNGKNVNRYPHLADSDDWGVKPSEGYEVVLTDEEVKLYETDRSARDILNTAATPKAPFHDRQLQKALECVLAQLE
jgi:carboxyl-terminal processing protease